jgi:hypothetical protein
MANAEIRMRLVATGVKHYEVADALGIADTSFSRKMRKELPEAMKSKILSIIDELSGGQTEATQ